MEWKIPYILAATVAIPLSSMVVAANISRVRKNYDRVMDDLITFLSYSAFHFCKEPPSVKAAVSDRLHAITLMVVRSAMAVVMTLLLALFLPV
jgi:chaperone required for assembly of F1-ATPase